MKYWPNKQSLELNVSVADLFAHTYQKFSDNLSNLTDTKIPIDFVDSYMRKQLFTSVLVELEILILDLIELDISLVNIMRLSIKLLYDLINKSMQSFLLRIKSQLQYNYINYTSLYIKCIFVEHRLLIDNLLKYLIFGSSAVQEKLYPFNNFQTPFQHVTLLLDNSIIQISNAIIFSLLYNIRSLPQAVDFFVSNNFCNLSYISIRSLALFKNTLSSNTVLNWYFFYPKNIYSSRYKLWVLCSLGLTSKYIIVNRSEDSLRFEKLQLLILFFLELQDFVIPKVRNFVAIFGRLFFYMLINILFSISKTFVKILLYILNQVKN